MKMNASRCAFMDITLSKFRRFGLYNINGQLIPHANYIKLLGVFIAFDLCWNYHVEVIRAKCAKLLKFVGRNLKGCSPRVLRQSYQALIRPVMFHGVSGWQLSSKENVTKLQRFQNRASRCQKQQP
jgi:hypothetical protein